jgi:hypothetical protein
MNISTSRSLPRASFHKPSRSGPAMTACDVSTREGSGNRRKGGGIPRAILFLAVALLAVVAFSGCDSSDGEERGPDPDDIAVVIEQTEGSSRDRIKATVTSGSDQGLELITVTLSFFDGDDVQIGQMPIPFIGTFENGDSAELGLGLPASILRHSSYACYRYRVDVTNEDGVTRSEEYGGTCG